MKNILIFLFICFGFALNSQITITCYECKKNTTVDCKGCNIQSNLFTGIVIKEKGKPDIPLYEPYKVSNKSSVFTFEDAFGTKTIVNVTSVLSYNTPKKLYDYLSNCLCKPSTIDTDTDRYSVLIQDSILVTYDINGVEIDRDTIRLFDIDTDTKTFLVQDSILVYYDIQNNEIGRDTIKIPFVDTDIQTYLTQDSILVYYDESNTEIDRDTIDIPNITEQGDFRISNDTLYHNNSIDGIEQFVKLPSIDTTTQSYLPILSGLDTIGYENITYLGGVEVDRDTIDIPNITEQGDFRISNDTLYHNNSIDGIEQFVKLPSIDTTTQSYLPILSGLDTIGYENITYLGGVEVDRDTIDIPNITEQGDFRISNDTLYHNNSIDGIEQFVKLPTLDTTTQSYLPILNGLDTIGYENITYLGGVEVDRDTITLPLHKNQVQSNETQAVPYTGVELPTLAGVNTGDTKSVKFNDGTVVNYTWNGAWVKDFVEEPFNPIDETTCTTFDEKILVEKLDGTFVTRPANSIKRNEVFPAGNYTVLPTDEIIYAVGGSTITLQGCTTCKEKTIYRDACSDGLITILPPSGQTIDGVHTSRVLQVGRGAFTYECVNGEWRIKSEFFEKDQAGAAFSLLNSNVANVTVFTLDGLPYSVDWGDGTNSGSIASGVATSHAYATPFTGDVTIIKTCGVGPIYRVDFYSGNWNFDIIDLNQFPNLTSVTIISGITTGDISNLPSVLTFYYNAGQNTTTGNISNLPSVLTTYYNGGQNTTTGDISNLPNGLTYYYNEGQNTTTGNIANLPSGLTFYTNAGQNTTTGDISNLPNGLTYYYNGGQNTTTGDIANLPSTLTYYFNSGQNTTSGDIANLPSGLTFYTNAGQNTTTGDISNLPNGLTYYYNEGQNTTTGNISNLPSVLTTYYNGGQNTTTGDISNLPSVLTYYYNGGQNTTTGDIANLPSVLTYYYNAGQNTVSDYSGGNLNSGITRFDSFSPFAAFNSTEVDNLIIELASTLPGISYIRIAGGASAPTAASLTARNQLIAAGTTLITN
jgi:hypothetical protein